MKTIAKTFITTLLATLLLVWGGCHPQKRNSHIVVTIAPLKHIVEQITCGDYSISVLVPQGASPETFEPTPKQMAEVHDAQLVFTTGLIEFEKSLLKDVDRNHVVDLSTGIQLIEGSCSHHHSHHDHHHGVDPHIWTSPQELRQMATTAHAAIIRQYPDSTKYTAAYDALCARLEALDEECKQAIKESGTQAFMVYHPAMTYYARAYGIEQIAIEYEGKEPSAKYLSTIIDQAHEKNIKAILYQAEYPKSVVEVVANDVGVKALEINPLAEDVETTIRTITTAITAQNE
jgi:zinc transport system substrate-binding protein